MRISSDNAPILPTTNSTELLQEPRDCVQECKSHLRKVLEGKDYKQGVIWPHQRPPRSLPPSVFPRLIFQLHPDSFPLIDSKLFPYPH
jgi:hypothetical protein